MGTLLAYVLILFLQPFQISSAHRHKSPPSSPSPVPIWWPPPSPDSPHFPKLNNENQLNNIIDALIGAGDFLTWANILSVYDPTLFPLSATFFVPYDDVSLLSSTRGVDPFVFPYHVVPQRLSFDDLRLFKEGSRIPTLLPSHFIVVTNTSAGNFSIDGVGLSNPDMFSTDTVVVHGIDSVLDYSRTTSLSDVTTVSAQMGAFSPPPVARDFRAGDEQMLMGDQQSNSRSHACCLSVDDGFVVVLTTMLFFIVFLVYKE